MAEETTRFKIPYPSEGQAAYFDVFTSMMNSIDSLDFADFEERNSVIFGGGNMSWDLTGADNLKWDAPISFATPSHGQKITIPASASCTSATGLGGILIPSGNFMYVDATRGPTSTVSLSDVEVGPQLPISSVSQVICYHDPTSGSLFFATSLVLLSGGTTAAGVLPFTQVTTTVTDGNAVQVRGIPICVATPTNGQVLVYDASTNEWCPKSPSPGTTYNYVVGKGNYATYNPNNSAGKQTIANAITDAAAVVNPNTGVTAAIYIQEGVYTENLTIPAGISLIGAGVEWDGDDVSARTRIVGQHSVTPFTHGGLTPYDKVLASTQIKGIDFVHPYSALNLPVLTITDVGLGVQAICNLTLSNCSRWEQNTGTAPPQAMVNVTPFLSAVLANASAEVVIDDCKIGGGYPKTHGAAYDDFACIRLEGSIEASVRNSSVSFEGAPIAPNYPWVGPAFKLVGATVKLAVCEVKGGIYGDAATVNLINSEWHARWNDATNVAKSGFFNLNGSAVTVSNCDLYSNEGTIEGNVFFFFRSSGAPTLEMRGVNFLQMTGLTTGWRAGADSNWTTVTKDATTPVANYLGRSPGVDTGSPKTEAGLYSSDTKVTGKLTVTGLIDPTGLILTEAAAAAVPTTTNEGAIFVSDGTAPATNTNSLYYKDESGNVTDIMSIGTLRNMTADIDNTLTPYTVDSVGPTPNHIIAVNPSVNIRINLPAAASTTRGRELRIMDITGAANGGGLNGIRVFCAGTDTISGVPNGGTGAYEITTAYGAIMIVCDGVSRWNIVSKIS